MFYRYLSLSKDILNIIGKYTLPIRNDKIIEKLNYEIDLNFNIKRLFNIQTIKMNNINITVMGDGNSGKTAFLYKIVKGYIRHDVKGVVTSKFDTTYGDIIVNFTETFYNDIPKNSQGIIVMLSLTDEKFYKNAEYYLSLETKLPIVVCGTKFDIGNLINIPESDKVFELVKKLNSQYYNISSSINYNIKVPLLYLLKQIVNPKLEFR